MKVYLTAKAGNYGVREVAADPNTHALLMIDNQHHEIHGGDAYLVTYTGTVGNGSDIEIRIQTPDTDEHAHMVFDIVATGETDVDLYEATTLTDASGNRLTPVNRNRNSSNTSGLTICHTPGGSGDGNLIAEAIFGLDAGVVVQSPIGGQTGGRHEFVLKQNTAYLLRVTSGTDGNRISIVLDWYEHTAKN